MRRRVAITSVGILSSLGQNSGEVMFSLKTGRVAFARPAFDGSVVTCPIENFDVKASTGPFKEARYLNRGARLAVAAAMEAVRSSGLPKELLARAGLFAGVGPNLDIGGEFPDIHKGDLERRDLQALWILRFLPNTAASVVAKLAGIHGENLTVSTACAASLQAVGEAYRRIKDGYLDLALAGGGDSRLSGGGILAYKKAQALYIGNGPPDQASRPFDAGRSGFVPGEGGAFFLLEEWERARERGAEIYGEICGYGSSMDGYSMTAPDRNGDGGRMAVLNALEESEMDASRVETIAAHGTSTFLNDEREADLIAGIFGENYPAVIALKSWIGHAASACGALELAVSLFCMKEGFLPAIRNLRNPCRRKIHFLREGRAFSFRTFLIENFGFGGQNSALIIRRVE
jgi:3-oxoacyl-[acyl-carrier-protein] synthase II